MTQGEECEVMGFRQSSTMLNRLDPQARGWGVVGVGGCCAGFPRGKAQCGPFREVKPGVPSVFGEEVPLTTTQPKGFGISRRQLHPFSRCLNCTNFDHWSQPCFTGNNRGTDLGCGLY